MLKFNYLLEIRGALWLRVYPWNLINPVAEGNLEKVIRRIHFECQEEFSLIFFGGKNESTYKRFYSAS